MVGVVRVNEPCRLMTIHAFGKITVQKGVFDVELVDWLSARCSEVQHGADGRRLDHRGEGLMEVDAGALGEPADDPSGLSTLQCAIRMQLVLEEPFAGDDIGLCGAGHERPRAVALQGVEFGLHRGQPLRITKSGADT